MANVTFDTLKFVEKLRAAGVPEAQAKAEAEALVSVLAEAIEQKLATKDDIREVKADIAALEKTLKGDMAGLEKALRGDMAALERGQIVPMQRDLYVIKWMMGLVLGGIVAIILKMYFPG